LVRANILDAQDHQLFYHSSRAIVPPLRELRHNDTATSKILLGTCLFAQARASIRLRRRSLAWLPEWVRERRVKSSKRPPPESAWQAVTDAFAATVSIRPRSDRCLSSSIAFLDVGFSRHLDAQLVFGVYSSPFSAHCWVQAGDTVLNDRIENVRTFTPILAI
jgi:hypothetical protein